MRAPSGAATGSGAVQGSARVELAGPLDGAVIKARLHDAGGTRVRLRRSSDAGVVVSVKAPTRPRAPTRRAAARRAAAWTGA